MRRGGLLAATVAALVTMVALAAPVGAQTPTTISAAQRCATTKPNVIFIGEVTRIRDDTITFDVDEVKEGEGSAGTSVDIVYPNEFNARKLVPASSYQVAALMVGGQLRSVVPTAQLKACGQLTRHADGSAIDTSALVGVKDRLPRLALRIVIGVLVLLLVLVVLGRFFDRKSRYRPWQRPTWRRQ